MDRSKLSDDARLKHLFSLSQPTVLPPAATIAQWINMRSWPLAARAISNPVIALSSDVMSTLQNVAPNSVASASPASSFRSKMATFTPAVRRACTLARPSPEAPPVTMAESVESIFMMRLSKSYGRYRQPQAAPQADIFA